MACCNSAFTSDLLEIFPISVSITSFDELLMRQLRLAYAEMNIFLAAYCFLFSSTFEMGYLLFKCETYLMWDSF